MYEEIELYLKKKIFLNALYNSDTKTLTNILNSGFNINSLLFKPSSYIRPFNITDLTHYPLEIPFIAFSENLKLVKFLLKKGADPNFCTFDHFTPLHLSAFNDYKNTKILFKYGANPNLKDQRDRLPLVLLIDNIFYIYESTETDRLQEHQLTNEHHIKLRDYCNNIYKIVKLHLKNNIDLTMKYKNKLIIEDILDELNRYHHHFKIVRSLYYKIIKLLIKYGSDIESLKKINRYKLYIHSKKLI